MTALPRWRKWKIGDRFEIAFRPGTYGRVLELPCTDDGTHIVRIYRPDGVTETSSILWPFMLEPSIVDVIGDLAEGEP